MKMKTCYEFNGSTNIISAIVRQFPFNQPFIRIHFPNANEEMNLYVLVIYSLGLASC